MKVEWEYLFENINTTKEVAILKDDSGNTILKVFQGIYYHLTQPDFSRFPKIDSTIVLFGKEDSIVKKKYHKNFSSLSREELAQKKLICACNIIEADFLNQLQKKPIIRS